MLENVDRLLKSPANQRGRDFAIMLSSLANLGYAVEWRVINAADYGMPQRRRRVFFIGYHKSTDIHGRLQSSKDTSAWVTEEGVFAKAFPVTVGFSRKSEGQPWKLGSNLVELTERFNQGNEMKESPFRNSGVMVGHTVLTFDTSPLHEGPRTVLEDLVVEEEGLVGKEFFLDASSMPMWKSLKGAKKETRMSKEGFRYEYSEGGMVFPDPLDKPSRTIVTGEGGSSPSRFKHVIESPGSGRLRRLMPVELERLNMFPDGHTDIDGVSAVKRAFFMGNALVVGVVERLGVELHRKVFDAGRRWKT
jgi:DNA (cytosine-5)-methyltransferase 1